MLSQRYPGPAQLTQRLRTFLREQSGYATQVRISRNNHVYNCGDRDDDVYLLEAGQVKTTTYSRDGKKCLLSIYASGDIFGELSLLSKDRTETATVMRTATLWRIPVTRFHAALADQDLLHAFLGCLMVRMSEQQQVITNMVTMDSEHRLAAVLLALANKLGKRQAAGIRIDQRITQEELSWMVGTTRSRVGYFLKRFSEAGLVQRTKGSLIVVNDRSLAGYLEACF